MGLADLRKSTGFKDIIAKSKKVQKVTGRPKAGNSLITKIQNICEQVQSRLGKYKDEFELITTKERLHEYISKSIENGFIAIDTETTGLDPICDQIVGACIYTYNERAVYVPINHISYITNIRLDGQLTEKEVAEEFQRLIDAKTKVIMFNAKFDIRVIRHQLGVYMTPSWCGFIAGKCLKENEEEGNLKYLWKKYCSPDKEAEHFTFDKMFEGMKFNLIPITTAYLYAAKDAIMTMELYDFQKQYLDENSELCQKAGLTKIAKLYNEIELPIINAVADIEDAGIALDLDYVKQLSEKYNTLMNQQNDIFQKALEQYNDQLISYLNTHPDSKIETPLNISSSVQLAELFYDVLQLPSVSKKQPRGTGEDILKALNHPLSKLILDYRGTAKLVNTYVDKMPTILNKKTHRVHCSFNQYGTDCVMYDTIVPNMEFPGLCIGDICEQNIPNMQSGILYPFQITLFNRYGQLETSSHVIKFENERVIELIFDDGSNIVGTYKHPILMKGNLFCELRYIKIGDICISPMDKELKVIKINYLTNKTVYDFKVPQTHSFVSNNVISHNTGRFSCISAGTKISMPGGDKKIEDVKQGDWLYCYKDDGTLTLSRVKSCMFTGNKNCIKLYWKSKYNSSLKGELVCTPEHPIKTTKGWVKAQDLKETDSVFHVHRKECKNHVRLNGQFGQGNEEEHVWIKINYFNSPCHLDIHHKDENRLNNNPDNLVVCTRKEHINFHRQLKNGFCGAYDYTKDELYKKCESVSWDLRKLDYDYESLKGWLKSHKINYILKYTQSYNKRPTTIRSNGKPFKYKSLPLIKENCLYALELSKFDINEASSYFGINASKFRSACEKYNVFDNHNVYKIDKLEGVFPVYDLEIEDYHNFIANELCVHNSNNPNLQNIPSHTKDIRRMFTASRSITVKCDKELNLLYGDLIPTINGKKFSQDLIIGDIILSNKGDNILIKDIQIDKEKIKVILIERNKNV